MRGLVVVDKEAGWTSHDVVARCRRIFGQRRVGHAGTLDPDATGVLVIGIGPATRLLRFVGELPKVYRAEIVLGAATSTLDRSGELIGRWDMSGTTLPEVRAAAARLTGQIEQVPPMVSAVKVGGRPLYRLARQGVEVERAARPVTVHRFDIDETDRSGVYRAEIECSSGTYVRVLADDLGRMLGGGAHLGELRRTRIGPFTEARARRVDELAAALGGAPGGDAAQVVLPPLEAVRHLADVPVGPEFRSLVGHGAPFSRDALRAEGEGPWALVDENGLVAVYEAAPGNRMRPAVVLS